MVMDGMITLVKEIVFSGIVNPNKRNGTKFGYPTANILIDDKKLDGLYLGYTSLLDSENEKVKKAFHGKLPSLIFVGAAKTMGETEHRLETHILDFPKIELYGSEIKVEIVEKLRDNLVFDSAEELIEQMKIDEIQARKWFKL